VLFPYREAYYLLQREPVPGRVEHLTWEHKLATCKDRLEINIAKQRQGITGIVTCFHGDRVQRFLQSVVGSSQRGTTFRGGGMNASTLLERWLLIQALNADPKLSASAKSAPRRRADERLEDLAFRRATRPTATAPP
jgi:hypothetical protein